MFELVNYIKYANLPVRNTGWRDGRTPFLKPLDLDP